MPEDTTKPTSDSPSFFRSGVREPVVPTPALEPGKIVGDFKLLTQLGQGGMGQVWEAKQLSLSRQVAVKFVRPERVTKHQLELFAREARAGGRLSHSGIVAVYGHGESDGLAWIAMELVPGAWDLRDFLDEVVRMGDVPDGYDKKVAQFVAKVADAVQAAHDAGVIHRDLKPQNILITESDDPKVTDFGLARIVDEQALSHTGDFAGTYFYMSPEQVAAKRAGLDHRTDVFSLGVVLYEMLSFQRPFQGDTEHQIAEQILIKDPPALRTIRSKIPRNLAVICSRAIEKDRDKRYQSIKDFASDLRRWLENKPILATPPTTLDRCMKWVRRNPTKSASGALVVIAVALLSWSGLILAGANKALEEQAEELTATNVDLDKSLIAVMAQKDRAVAAEVLVNRRSYSAYMQAAQGAIAGGNLREADRLLDLCPIAYRDWEWNHLKLTIDPSLLTLEGHEGDINATSWSPDGTKIASVSDDQTLRLWDAESGDCLQIMKGHTAEVTSVSWSPDGTRIVSGSADKTLRIWNASDGMQLHVLTGHSTTITCVAWGGPEGERIVSVDDDELAPQLRFWNATSGKHTKSLDGHRSGVITLAWSADGTKLVSSALSGSSRSSPHPTIEWAHQIIEETYENALLLWNLEDDTFQAIDFPTESSIQHVLWNSNSMQFITGTYNGIINSWDAITGEHLNAFVNSPCRTYALAWSEYQTPIMLSSIEPSRSISHTIRIVDALDDQFEKSHGLYVGKMRLANFSPDAEKFVAVIDGHKLQVWDSATRGTSQVLKRLGDSFRVNAISVTNDGALLASKSSSATVRIWDLVTGESINAITIFSASSLSWDADGTQIVTGADQIGPSSIRVWDAKSGLRLTTIGESLSAGDLVAWSKDGKMIASNSFLAGDEIDPNGSDSAPSALRVHIWDADTAERLVAFDTKGQVFALAWSNDSRRLVVSSGGVQSQIWNARTGELTVFSNDLLAGKCLAWSPNDQLIVSGSRYSQKPSNRFAPRIWNAATGETVHVLEGHEGDVNSLAWNPSGTRIVSGGQDQTLRIWDSATGECLLVLEGHDGAVSDVEWSPDGARIYSSSNDSIRIWESAIEDAPPVWRHLRELDQCQSYVEDIFDRCDSLDSALESIDSDEYLSVALKEQVLQEARIQIAYKVEDSNRFAWKIVDPDREDSATNVEEGLRLAREATAWDPSSSSAADTLAWALFANELFEEALVESKRALALASEVDRRDYQEYLLRLQKLIDEARIEQLSDEEPGE
jgi:WD40 repeat protein